MLNTKHYIAKVHYLR